MTQGTARILDGKAIADTLLDSLRTRVAARVAAGKRAPGLAVILVGNDPASAVYVRNKRRAAIGREADTARHHLVGRHARR